MPTVSLRSFIATGHFGSLHADWTRQQLENEFGPPEAHGGGSRKHPYPTIWKYGDIEFFFEPYNRDDKMYMIFFDAFTVPSGWGQLVVDPWEISNRLTHKGGEALLRDNEIAYQMVKSPDPNCIDLLTESGVTLQFVVNQPDEYSFPVGLFAVSKQLGNNPARPVLTRSMTH